MSNSIKVSVIVPCYNVESTVLNCLGFIQDQSLKEIEVICVNDGSTDRTQEHLESFTVDDRFKIITQENKGLGGARNSGIEAATGEFITFIDADDWVRPDFLQKLHYKALEEGLDIVDCIHEELDENGVKGRRRTSIDIGARDYYLDLLAGIAPSNACARLYRSSMLMNHDLRFEEHLKHEDIPFTYKCYLYAKGHGTVPEALYLWNVVGGSISRTFSIKHAGDLLKSLRLDWDFISKQKAIPMYGYALRVVHIWRLILGRVNSIVEDKDQKQQIFEFLYQQAIEDPRVRIDKLTVIQACAAREENTKENLQWISNLLPEKFSKVFHAESIAKNDEVELKVNRMVERYAQRRIDESMHLTFTFAIARILYKFKILSFYPRYDITFAYLLMKIFKR